MSALLYFVMILTWGFSWIAIKWQHGPVPMEVSIFYRFAIAACLMFIGGWYLKKLQKTNRRQHLFFALQGLCLFCCNFIAFYSSTSYIASGLTAVVMATAPIFNAVHGKLFYKTPTSQNFWLGVAVGLTGISLLFAGDLLQTDWSVQVLIGLAYALAGTWCFSIGNMISIRNSRGSIQPFTATSYAMLYGCIALFSLITFKGLAFEISISPLYLGSLFYLAVPASVIGFTVYLVLVDRIGANSAAYLLVITPIVALLVSSVYEDYQWTTYSSVGLLSAVLGSFLTQYKKPLFSLFNRTKVTAEKSEKESVLGN
ncbi:DMT family transporter [Psychromonas ossibalaenae]|uniref:DMT family transporter n=1 Tax=Psychromonas ossibalaenae TaxID=444922 RepID=UPI000372628C|nr:EamA family transporter [Psychromonas ossibalaenae]